MDAVNFDLQKYFTRIGFNRKAKPDIATITEMMKCQLFSVPFENLDVQAGKIVSLIPEEIVEKILYRNRGGYCYEVNGLFAMALQTLGIHYQFVAARPMFYRSRHSPTWNVTRSAWFDNYTILCEFWCRRRIKDRKFNCTSQFISGHFRHPHPKPIPFSSSHP
jgi:N-hydroxyarylamine O-acetyltransferase